MDMKYNASTYIWNNKQEGPDRVFSKINRTLVSMKWVDLFLGAETTFLPEGLYDHCPALVKFLDQNTIIRKPFRYFNMWSSVPEFLMKVKQSWDVPVMGNPMYCLMEKLKRLKPVLKGINRDKFSNIERRVEEDKKRLNLIQHKIQCSPTNINRLNEEVQIAKELWHNQKAMESFLRQNRKLHWLRDGDQITKFFHQSIRMRRYQKASHTTNKQGELKETPDGVMTAFIEYYTDLLGTAQVQ